MCWVQTTSSWGQQSSHLAGVGGQGCHSSARRHLPSHSGPHLHTDSRRSETAPQSMVWHIWGEVGSDLKKRTGPLKLGCYPLLGLKHASTPMWSSHGKACTVMTLSLTPKSHIADRIFQNSCHFVSHRVAAGEVSPPLSRDSESSTQNRGCKFSGRGRRALRRNVKFLKQPMNLVWQETWKATHLLEHIAVQHAHLSCALQQPVGRGGSCSWLSYAPHVNRVISSSPETPLTRTAAVWEKRVVIVTAYDLPLPLSWYFQ